MNKIIIFIFTLCLSLLASAQVNYTIKGTANGMNGKTVHLLTTKDDDRSVDSCIINHNSFTFKGTQPKIYIATVMLDRMRIPVILENGTINVFFDNLANYIYPGKATGTMLNDIFCAYNKKISAIQLKIINLSQKKELNENKKVALNKKVQKLHDEIKAVTKEYLNQNLDNIIGAYTFNYIENTMSDEEFNKILANASPAMKEHYYTKRAVEHHKALMRTEIGQKFTDFKMRDPNDKEVSLSDYIGKKKYVLIDFWASWCGACRAQTPYLKAAYKKYASKEFEIVGVSLDSKKEAWLKAIKDLGLTWPQMSDLKGGNCKGAKLYGVYGIPSTFLIDPDGIIIAKNLRGEEIEKKLSELLN